MITLSKSEKHNENYLAKVIQLEAILPIPGADRVVMVMVNGNTVVTSKDAEIGQYYVYFPPESKINKDYLRLTNSFRNESDNAEFNKTGFFESNCRVRTMKLCKQLSQGYIVPISTFEPMFKDWTGFANFVGKEFDTVDGVLMVEKYVPRNTQNQNLPGAKGPSRKAKADILIPNQFKLHINTTHLKRSVGEINPDDIISITDKLHGTSLVAGNVLVKKQLTWSQKLLKRLGVAIQDTEYRPLVSSRNVIKNLPKTTHQSYYESDIWTKAATPILPFLQKGETIYAEIVGYLDTGKPIQGAQGNCWDYGCQPGTHAVYIYRITYTNPDGQTVELPMNMLAERAAQLGVRSVPILYYGKAEDFVALQPQMAPYSEGDIQSWRDVLVHEIETKYVEIGKCKYSSNKVEHEGIVLRKETLIPVPYKMKQASFVLKESQAMDKGEVDIETEELVEEE